MQINETTITGLAAGGLPDGSVDQDTLAAEAVNESKLQISNAGSNGEYLQKQSGNTGGLTWAAVSATDSSKMPLAGGTFTGDVTFDGATAGRDVIWDKSLNELRFENNCKLVVGSHASNRMFIQDDGTDIYIDSSHGKLYCRIAAESGWTLNNEGSFDAYYDNALKFATTGTGATIWGTLNETSDSSQKENVATITGATAKIKAINPVTFTWKKGTTAHPDREPTVKGAGVIAQELESVLPDFVGESTHPETGDKLKTVNYQALTGYLIATVKELEARIATLEAG